MTALIFAAGFVAGCVFTAWLAAERDVWRAEVGRRGGIDSGGEAGAGAAARPDRA